MGEQNFNSQTNYGVICFYQNISDISKKCKVQIQSNSDLLYSSMCIFCAHVTEEAENRTDFPLNRKALIRSGTLGHA